MSHISNTFIIGAVSAVLLTAARAIAASSTDESRDDALAAEAAEHKAPAACSFHADVEIDPLAYALDGYALHAGDGWGRWRVDLGAFAIAVPKFVHGNEHFDVSFDGYGAKVHYYVFAEQYGGFIGADCGMARSLVRVKSSDLAAGDRQVNVGVNAGWRFDLGAGLYATPWLGVGYAFGAEDVVLAGNTFEPGRVTFFPAVHVGYHLR
jgi:hypothetical protein